METQDRMTKMRFQKNIVIEENKKAEERNKLKWVKCDKLVVQK